MNSIPADITYSKELQQKMKILDKFILKPDSQHPEKINLFA